MNSFSLTQSCPQADELNDLLNISLGPGRLARTAERLRETNRQIEVYSHCARDATGVLLATISYWPIGIGAAHGLLLGPLAVHPSMQGQGVGQALMRASLDKIDANRFAFVLLVGDLPYYERAGFGVAPVDVSLPGPVDAARLLLRPTADAHATLCAALSGQVRPAPELC